jgi:hypothetical protein
MATDRERSYGKDYNAAGYIEINPDSYNWFNQNLGTNFGSAEDYYKWIYGGGNLVSGSDLLGQGYDVANNAMYLQTPNGVQNTVNAPLSYEPTGMEFGDLVLAGIMAGGAAGLTGMLPGTANVFAPGYSFAPIAEGAAVEGAAGAAAGFPANHPYWSMTADASGLTGTMTDAAGAAAGQGTTGYLPYGEAGAQAIDGMAQSIYDGFATAGIPGYSPALTSGVAAGGAAGSSLASMGGSALGGLTDFLKNPITQLVGGKILPSVLGYMGASNQADSYRDMFNQYFGAGAPFRQAAVNTLQPGFSMMNEPGFKDAMETAQNVWARAASAGNAQGVASGNPYENPGASLEGQKYLMGSLGLPALQNYRSWLTNAGQLGMSQAVPFGQGQIGAEGGKYDAIGYGLSEIFNPKPKYGFNFDPTSGQFKLTTGGGLV